MLEVGEMRGSKKGVQRANGPLRGRASARLAKANRRFAERSQRRIYPVMADAPEAVTPLRLRNEILLTQYEIRLRRCTYFV